MANIKKGMHVYDGLHENLEEPKDKTNNVPTLRDAHTYFKSAKTMNRSGIVGDSTIQENTAMKT